ncbi:MAG TPA: dihydrofolate reductase family protein [Candidatus Limnocylindrales bacterium]|nr:dihydrofolate reductase family protein [Candidatus Limnocylindrales bacterium]
MGKVRYLMNVSLDGFIETIDHGLDWTLVDEELHAWFNEQEAEVEALLYGRRLYEVMAAYWPTAESDPDITPVEVEFARIWNAKPKLVFSSTLESVDGNSRLVRGDVVEELDRIREEFHGDLGIGGATLAADLVRRKLVDEYGLVVHPVILGAGMPFFPSLARPLDLELFDTHRFSSGVIYLGYRPR